MRHLWVHGASESVIAVHYLALEGDFRIVCYTGKHKYEKERGETRSTSKYQISIGPHR